MVGATIIDIRAITIHFGCVILTIFGVRNTFLIGLGIDRIQSLGYSKHALGQIKKGGCINLFLDIHLLVYSQILLLNRLQPDIVDTQVLLVGRILQQVGHQLLGLIKILSTLQYGSCFANLFALSTHRGTHHNATDSH